ncbi:hypothetical protein, partial [Xanthomonas euvesicatoria]|uniref:hypothetical protein n=1 Tax=Xanthomonas euvesicatoria TaxID=456327 RepID=UPI0038919CCD
DLPARLLALAQALSVTERQLHGSPLNIRRVVSRICGALFRGSLAVWYRLSDFSRPSYQVLVHSDDSFRRMWVFGTTAGMDLLSRAWAAPIGNDQMVGLPPPNTVGMIPAIALLVASKQAQNSQPI